ncbi:UDP-N-acetylglucosamine acyltransferase [Striga asiatica]|uniref:UDP-N-acetylglucosamine acyltransferase n=1 Tax=Striga asiatica TaxID=4170 RepID=A0A5A7NYU7_STRAF|nr:UDP-N-acetylglucosamine acyltransferase [Striga asiatica]
MLFRPNFSCAWVDFVAAPGVAAAWLSCRLRLGSLCGFFPPPALCPDGRPPFGHLIVVLDSTRFFCDGGFNLSNLQDSFVLPCYGLLEICPRSCALNFNIHTTKY